MAIVALQEEKKKNNNNKKKVNLEVKNEEDSRRELGRRRED